MTLTTKEKTAVVESGCDRRKTKGSNRPVQANSITKGVALAVLCLGHDQGFGWTRYLHWLGASLGSLGGATLFMIISRGHRPTERPHFARQEVPTMSYFRDFR